MGVLTGFDGHIDTGAILEKRITLQGIYVGPVATLASLVKTGITPRLTRCSLSRKQKPAITRCGMQAISANWSSK